MGESKICEHKLSMGLAEDNIIRFDISMYQI